MPQSNRRHFLKFAGSVPATAVVPGALLTAAASQAGESMTSTALTRQKFLALVGQSFDLSLDGEAFGVARTAKLTSVEDLPHCSNHAQSFRAVFEVVSAQGAQQALWQVAHPSLGQHAIFMSPNDAQGRVLEAVFNRG